MNHQYNALWLSVSPQLQRFDQRLLQRLIKTTAVRQWNYRQTSDEPCCLETCLVLLHDYLKQQDQPMHLLGHGMSGIAGLLYARRHPERVASLTLLSVGANPTISWQTEDSLTAIRALHIYVRGCGFHKSTPLMSVSWINHQQAVQRIWFVSCRFSVLPLGSLVIWFVSCRFSALPVGSLVVFHLFLLLYRILARLSC